MIYGIMAPCTWLQQFFEGSIVYLCALITGCTFSFLTLWDSFIVRDLKRLNYCTQYFTRKKREKCFYLINPITNYRPSRCWELLPIKSESFVIWFEFNLRESYSLFFHFIFSMRYLWVMRQVLVQPLWPETSQIF